MEFFETQQIADLLIEGKNYAEISDILQRSYPNTKGLSERSVRRFCRKNNLSSRLPQAAIDNAVSEAVQTVGATYGRKMMKGYLAATCGLNVSEMRVGKALRSVAPVYHAQRRTNTARQVNPIPYRADYFGHKLHVDQNEKLAMYGCTHVVAIDGHSRFVVSYTSMPIKNNIEIYDKIYREGVLQYGLFDQIRVDHGREFYLMLGIQEHLSHLRTNQEILPYKQTQSKKNLPIERFWVEINSRVNYPIKTCLVEMDNRNEFDIENDLEKYCVSWVTRGITRVGMDLCVNSWNLHPIAGRGIPDNFRLASGRRLRNVEAQEVPEPVDAVAIYGNTFNGHFTERSQFGVDPLEDYPYLSAIRLNSFNTRFDFRNVFAEVVNNSFMSFQQMLRFYIEETRRLENMI